MEKKRRHPGPEEKPADRESSENTLTRRDLLKAGYSSAVAALLFGATAAPVVVGCDWLEDDDNDYSDYSDYYNYYNYYYNYYSNYYNYYDYYYNYYSNYYNYFSPEE